MLPLLLLACDPPTPPECRTWRGEPEADCILDAAVEGWPEAPEASTTWIEALADPALQDFAWLRIVRESGGCMEACDRIVEPVLQQRCLTVVTRPHLSASLKRPSCADGCTSSCPETPAAAEPPGSPLRATVRKARLQLSAPQGSMEHHDAIAAVLEDRASQLRYCYEQRLMVCPCDAGSHTLALTITAGRVTEAEAGEDLFSWCIEREARGWQFPEAVTAEVVVPFDAWAE